MATIKDVAKAASCSISTVSYVMNNDTRIPEKTANRIKEIAHEIGYFPLAAARRLKKKNTDTVIIAISDFGGPVYHELLNGIQFQLAKHNYTMIVSTGISSENLLRERSADGAVITDIHISDDFLLRLARNFSPIIVLDRSLSAENIYNMTINNHDVMKSFVTLMIEKGYQKFVYVHGVNNTYDNLTRYSGFRNALEAQKIAVFKEYYGDFTENTGRLIADSIMDNKEEFPDIYICANDETAIGMMESFQARGFKIPDDFGVSGFDDILLAAYFNPRLSTIKINHFDWGKSIADTLVRLMQQKSVHIEKQQGVIVLRESV